MNKIVALLVLLAVAFPSWGRNIFFEGKVFKFNTTGFVVNDKKRDAGRCYISTSNKSLKIICSLYLEKKVFADGKSCREEWWAEAKNRLWRKKTSNSMNRENMPSWNGTLPPLTTAL